jgi:hypothetical protein
VTAVVVALHGCCPRVWVRIEAFDPIVPDAIDDPSDHTLAAGVEVAVVTQGFFLTVRRLVGGG